MINWELPHEPPVCPHCGSTETQLTLQLLGLIRYSCNACRKSFATNGDAKQPRVETRSETPDPTARQV